MLKLDSSMPSIDILVALLQRLIRFKWLVLFFLITILTTLLWQQRADHAIATEPNAGTFAGGKDTYSDSLVLGRINRAHQEGTFSQYGLLGWYSDRRSGIGAIAKANESIEYYLENKSAHLPVRSKPLREPYPYRGNVGIQGWFLYAIDSGLRLFSVPPQNRLYVLENTNRVLLASLFSAILIMLAQRGFFFPSAAAWLMLIGSNWLAIYSASLYWSLWLWVLPVFAAYYIKIHIPTSIALERSTWGQTYLTKPFVSEIIIAILVFISFLKGFEVTTPMLVCIGLCYIALPLTQFKIWDTLKAGTISVVACFIGILMAIIATVTLTAFFLGSLKEGIDTFTSRITKSTSFVSDNNVQNLYEVPSLQAVDIHLWLNEQVHLFWLEIGAGEMLSFSITSLLMISVLVLITQQINEKPLQWSDKIIPVIIFVFIGFSATASWLFVAAQHSLLHRGILRGIWILPFLPLAAGLLFWAFQYTVKVVHANAVAHNIRGKSLLAFSALPIFVILISASAIASLTQHTFKVAPERANHAFWIMQKKPELQPLNRMPESSAFFTYARRRILIIGQCDAFDPDDNIQIKIAIQSDPVNFSRIPTYGTPTCRFITKAAAVPEMGFSIETQTGKILHVETSSISCPNRLKPYNLTDRTWVNGIHKNKRGFFIENTALNQACLSQPSAKLSIDNTMTDFQLNITMKYIEVWIEQAILDDASNIRLQVQSSAP